MPWEYRNVGYKSSSDAHFSTILISIVYQRYINFHWIENRNRVRKKSITDLNTGSSTSRASDSDKN